MVKINRKSIENGENQLEIAQNRDRCRHSTGDAAEECNACRGSLFEMYNSSFVMQNPSFVMQGFII